MKSPCNGQPNQGWLFQRVTGTRYMFINQADGLCINEFEPLVNGALVLMVGCARVSNEEWQTHAVLPFALASLESRSGNRDSGFCADGGLTRALLMLRCDGRNSQIWNIS